jgi:diketogulonate reductase-like aldo/keto reductase
MTQPTVTLRGDAAVEMPLLGFGTWQITGRQCYDAVSVALAVGYRHLDTATMYGNEAEVGRALADSGVAREDVFVTTKLPPRNAGRAARTLEASLDALGTSYVDLWLIHWPSGGPLPNAWEALLAARDAGQARAVGVSNYSVEQIDALTKWSGQTPQVNQIPWAPSLYSPRTVAALASRGVVLEGYSALKNTDLGDPVLMRIADAHGVTTAQVVIRWHLDHGVVVIPKSVRPERITANFDVFGFELSAEELAEVDGLSRRR